MSDTPVTPELVCDECGEDSTEPQSGKVAVLRAPSSEERWCSAQRWGCVWRGGGRDRTGDTRQTALAEKRAAQRAKRLDKAAVAPYMAGGRSGRYAFGSTPFLVFLTAASDHHAALQLLSHSLLLPFASARRASAPHLSARVSGCPTQHPLPSPSTSYFALVPTSANSLCAASTPQGAPSLVLDDDTLSACGLSWRKTSVEYMLGMTNKFWIVCGGSDCWHRVCSTQECQAAIPAVRRSLQEAA
ncbi:hypothetical protein FOMPIDRAFT_115821 [Fomitopsis schrenkii]|uniref:Uncharacterized protein n=1 Tax=Fomitopsis schrenkii TaxID=2126942 RepID=S8EIW9_FOMSC|nr:hypothetical protein FOMPIDRAFT_115821 [Fomitopsis schrenkii]